MENKLIIAAVCLNKNKDLINNIPVILVENESELEKISSEVGKILEGRVYRLSNGLVIIAPPTP